MENEIYTERWKFNRKKLVGLGKSFELVINGLTPPYTLKTRKKQELKFWCIGLCVCVHVHIAKKIVPAEYDFCHGSRS